MVNRETMESVSSIVEGLGFQNVTIRALTGRVFLAYFEDEEDSEHMDINFLEIGFQKVRRVQWKDLIPSRKVWIEIRGLPLIAWTEVNYQELLKNWGEILQFDSIVDEENVYQLPKVQIETKEVGKIDSLKKISIER